jgi:hypothetical protein
MAMELGELAGFALIFFVFFDRCDDAIGRNTGGFRVNLPERRVRLDALVEARLGMVGSSTRWPGGGSHQVDDYIGIRCAIFGSEAADADYGVGIFGVDVEDRNALAFGDVRGKRDECPAGKAW